MRYKCVLVVGIPELLNKLRSEGQYTKAELAKALKVSTASIGYMITGKRRIKIAHNGTRIWVYRVNEEFIPKLTAFYKKVFGKQTTKLKVLRGEKTNE